MSTNCKKKIIFGCSPFQKFNFDCLLLLLLICSPNTENIFKLACPLWTQSSIMVSGTQIYFTLFLASSTKLRHQVKFVKKKYFLDHCLFTYLFHDVDKLRRKPKIGVKVIQRFWCVQCVGLLSGKFNL